MRKINKILGLGTLLLGSSVFASVSPSNIVTYIETNSPLSMYSSNFVTYDGSVVNIGELFKNNTYGNYSPFYFKSIQNSPSYSPSVIFIIGEKSINIGSFFSKSFMIKSNVNNMFLAKENLGVLSSALDYLDKNNLIYIKTKDMDSAEYLKTLDSLIAFLKDQKLNQKIDDGHYQRKMNSVEFLKEVVTYTEKIFNETYAVTDMPVMRSPAMDPSSKIGTSPQYVKNSHTYTRTCYDSKQDGTQLVFSIDITKPVKLETMWDYFNYPCFDSTYLTDSGEDNYFAGYFRRYYRGLIKIPSNEEKRKAMESIIRKNYLKGNSRASMRTLNSKINTSTKSELKYFREQGYNNNKIININYGFTGIVKNNYVRMGLIKDVSTGIVFNDQINMNNYNTYPFTIPPVVTASAIEDGKASDGRRTLYNIYKQELMPNGLKYQNLLGLSPAVASAKFSASNSGFIRSVSDKNGAEIPSLLSDNNGMLEYDETNPLYSQEIEDRAETYAFGTLKNSYVNNKEVLYPLDIVNINSIAVITNNNYIATEPKSLKYFGPEYNTKIILDKYTNQLGNLELFCGVSYEPKTNENYKYQVFTEKGIYKIESSSSVMQKKFNDYKYNSFIYLSDKAPSKFFVNIGKVSKPEECNESSIPFIVSKTKLIERLDSEYVGMEEVYDDGETYVHDGKFLSDVYFDSNIFSNPELKVEPQKIAQNLDDTTGEAQRSLLKEIKIFMNENLKLSGNITLVPTVLNSVVSGDESSTVLNYEDIPEGMHYKYMKGKTSSSNYFGHELYIY